MRGYDPDGDSLVFGVTGAGSGLVRLEARDEYSADVFLRRDLDHEVGIMMCIMGQGLIMCCDQAAGEHSLLLTLTDGHLGEDNFITQPLLILVEDTNDNSPVFVSIPRGEQLQEAFYT